MHAHFYDSFPHCFSECLSKQVYHCISCMRASPSGSACSRLSVHPVTGYRSGHCPAWSPTTGPGPGSAHLAWPHTCRAQQHKTGPNTNSSMVRNLSEKLITKCNVLIHVLHFVYRSAPHCTGQPLLHVSVVLRNALSPLTRCGPYDTRYHSRQTHTK